MADFVALWNGRSSVVADLLAIKQAADASRDDLIASATRIQAAFRGSLVRGDLTIKGHAATEIARLARGASGRRRSTRALQAKREAEEAALYEYCATQIQKTFRGSHSRRHQHDYYARQAYIRGIRDKSEQLRAELQTHLENQVISEAAKEEEKARKEFQTVTQGFHHLVSTQSIPGVFNPPFARTADEVPSAFGVPMETHLRVGVKAFLRTRGLRRSKGVPTYATTRQSMRSQGVFGSEVDAERQEKRSAMLNQTDARPFTGGGTTNVFDPLRSGSAGVMASTPYEEAWKSSQGQRDLANHPTNKAKRVSEAPFYTTAPKGILFEDVERERSREAASRGRRVLGLTGTTRGPGSRGHVS